LAVHAAGAALVVVVVARGGATVGVVVAGAAVVVVGATVVVVVVGAAVVVVVGGGAAVVLVSVVAVWAVARTGAQPPRHSALSAHATPARRSRNLDLGAGGLVGIGFGARSSGVFAAGATVPPPGCRS